ncbi:MAG: tripartite tricarboxylate transporter TctB family protein [Hyphomicrobiales bacterium]|nr:tripartite tricarboxylate transporter TctB family protein [Hyphomicrobiales bacterium]
MSRVRQFEIGASLFMILVCAIFIYESLGLPPGSFEPLGSAPVPQATAGLIILLCVIVIVSAIRGRAEAAEAEQDEAPDDRVSALLLAAGTLLYVVFLQYRWVGFGTLTAIYLFGIISALERFRPKAMIGAAVVGLVFGYGIQYLFTQVFVVDLPAS